MKKIFLSFSVIFLFILYAFHQGGENANLQVIAPSFQSPTPSQAPLPTSTPVSAAGNPPDSNPSPIPTSTPIPVQASSQYKDGQYVGDISDAYYGNVQVQVTIQNGKIADVVFLDYPHDRRTSQMINSQAMPYLKQEAIQAQNSQVDIISGATATSGAFITSLESALAKAKA